MAAIAERRLVGVLATAEKSFAVLLCSIFHRRKPRPRMRAIAERLARRFTAGTPEIGLSLRHLDGEGGFLGDVRSVCLVAWHGWGILPGWLRLREKIGGRM